jgi:hypothetical protein
MNSDTKPRITVVIGSAGTIYFCEGLGWTAVGDSARKAYERWRGAVDDAKRSAT